MYSDSMAREWSRKARDLRNQAIENLADDLDRILSFLDSQNPQPAEFFGSLCSFWEAAADFNGLHAESLRAEAKAFHYEAGIASFVTHYGNGNQSQRNERALSLLALIESPTDQIGPERRRKD